MPEYKVPHPREPSKFVAFDGHVTRGVPPQEIFLEAKRGYEFLDRAPDSKHSLRVVKKLEDEVQRQLDVIPKTAKLEWHVSTEAGATAIRNLIRELEDGMKIDAGRIAIIATGTA